MTSESHSVVCFVTLVFAQAQCGFVCLENSITSSSLPCSTDLMYRLILHPLPQIGNTAVLLAALKGHKDLVQELCETFGADFLHRDKVRTMLTASDSEWLSNCACVSALVGCDL